MADGKSGGGGGGASSGVSSHLDTPLNMLRKAAHPEWSYLSLEIDNLYTVAYVLQS